MSQLAEALQARIAQRNSLEELAKVFEETLREIDTHEEESLSFLAGAPDDLVGPERQAVGHQYQAYRDLISDGQEKIRDQSALQQIAERLSTISQELGLALTRLREIGWAARGPSSHPGANELLAILDGLAQGEALEERFEQVVEQELERIRHQAPVLDSLPDFAREPQEKSLLAYEQWMVGVLEAGDDDPREWDDMMEELEQWAADYSCYDLDFLIRRYSGVPTAIPAVNFALNCQMLELQELIAPEMVDYAIDSAQGSLREGQDSFLASASLNDVERARHEELVGELCDDLDELPEVEDAEELQQLGAEVIAKAAELVSLHRRTEGGQAGSRMDYRDGA